VIVYLSQQKTCRPQRASQPELPDKKMTDMENAEGLFLWIKFKKYLFRPVLSVTTLIKNSTPNHIANTDC